MSHNINVQFDGDDDWQFFDQYHALAGQVQFGIAGILDQVLQRHGVASLETRKKIVDSFLFDFSSALDNQSPIEASNHSESENWYPALCFLSRKKSHEEPFLGKVTNALISTNTSLHDIALDQSHDFYNNGKA